MCAMWGGGVEGEASGCNMEVATLCSDRPLLYGGITILLYNYHRNCVGYIFENLPGGTFNDIVRLFLSLELMLTFPIVFKPASDVMEEIWFNFLTVR